MQYLLTEEEFNNIDNGDKDLIEKLQKELAKYRELFLTDKCKYNVDSDPIFGNTYRIYTNFDLEDAPQELKQMLNSIGALG